MSQKISHSVRKQTLKSIYCMVSRWINYAVSIVKCLKAQYCQIVGYADPNMTVVFPAWKVLHFKMMKLFPPNFLLCTVLKYGVITLWLLSIFCGFKQKQSGDACVIEVKTKWLIKQLLWLPCRMTFFFLTLLAILGTDMGFVCQEVQYSLTSPFSASYLWWIEVREWCLKSA